YPAAFKAFTQLLKQSAGAVGFGRAQLPGHFAHGARTHRQDQASGNSVMRRGKQTTHLGELPPARQAAQQAAADVSSAGVFSDSSAGSNPTLGKKDPQSHDKRHKGASMKTRHQEFQYHDEGWRPMPPVSLTERFKASSTLWAQWYPRPRTCHDDVEVSAAEDIQVLHEIFEMQA